MRSYVIKLAASVLCAMTIQNLGAEEATPAEVCAPQKSMPQKAEKFQPFTGRVTTNKVRMRLNPSLDSLILQDFSKGDLLVVVDEDEDFFAVEPPRGTEAYVFRTFVLDGAIEGSHVNVRLDPELSSPVIAQLNTGDKVRGEICPTNSKWLKITPPRSCRFYVSKDYVQKAGGPEMLAKLEQRQEEAEKLLTDALERKNTEMAKPFEDIDIDAVTKALEYIINEYPDFENKAEQAAEALAEVQDQYLHQKIDYLESRATVAATSWKDVNRQINDDLSDYQNRLAELEQEIALEMGSGYTAGTVVESTEIRQPKAQDISESLRQATAVPAYVTRWEPQELALFEQWQSRHEDCDMRDFYEDQLMLGTTLTGVLEPYDRPVKNRPGDYVLLDPQSHRPIAYLYSTVVDLRQRTGKQITLVAAERPNHNFAFPAYFALEMQ